MSTNYEFYIVTKKTPREIGEITAKANNVTLDDSRSPPCYYVSTEESSTQINYFGGIIENELRRREKKQEWLKAYGFIPDVEANFAYYANYDPTRKLDGIRKSVVQVLKIEKGNAVLMIDAGITVLERIDERIVITNEKKYSFIGYEWLKEELENSGLHYEERLLEYRQV